MIYAILPLATILLICLLASAALPLLALRERRLTVLRKRALHDKSAGQIRHLAWWMQALIAVALTADLLADGLVVRVAVGPLRSVLSGVVVLAVAAALLSLLSLLAGKRFVQSKLSALAGGMSALCALGTACGGALLLWFFLRNPALPIDDSGTGGTLLPLLTSLISSPDRLVVLFYGLECLTLSLAAGQALVLCWHVLRRSADDFGRDYYAFAVKRRSRLCAYAGALILPFSAVLLWLTPAFSPERLPELLPTGAGVAFWALSLGSLCLPLAVLCWYLLARSEAPMRKKYLIFAAPLLLWAGVFSLLARLWV